MGAGISELHLRRPFKLSEYCSIFLVEDFSFRETAEIASNAGNNIKIINIYVDSQAEFKAIILHRTTSDDVFGCRKVAAYILASRP